MTTLLILGFLIGLTHAFEADHLAALSSMMRRNEGRANAWLRGGFWGLGHMATLTLVSLPLLFLGQSPSTPVSASLELMAGVMLLVLGGSVWFRLYRDRVHFHVHSHADGERHLHLHSHAKEQGPHRAEAHAHAHPDPLVGRAFFVGMIHGLAGSAALFVLASTSVPNAGVAAVYILLFGLGGTLGMAVMSLVLAFPLQFGAGLMTRGYSAVQIMLGGVTVFLGARLAWENGQVVLSALTL